MGQGEEKTLWERVAEAARQTAQRIIEESLPRIQALQEQWARLACEILSHVAVRWEPFIKDSIAQISASLVAPGTFLGDVFTVYDGSYGEAETVAALYRLIEGYFPQRAVFHHARWLLLADALRERFPNGTVGAWRELCAPNLLVAIKQVQGDYPIVGLYRFLRRETRKNIERDLLGGLTLDELRSHKAAPLPDEDTEEKSPEALAIEAKLAKEWGDLADMRLDLLAALDRLSEAEREALFAPYTGVGDAEIARRDGVSVGAIRERRRKARAKLKFAEKSAERS